jgi:hypothetical protein
VPGLYFEWKNGIRRAARRKTLIIVLAAAIPVAGRLLLLPWMPPPVPSVHDEFSYLLAAGTFAAGRLTNPTPPFPEHFETFHVQMKPTYMSVYPAGQGALMAAGIKLCGHPWAGVVLSVGLMCAAVAWMLEAWLPPAWALLGTVLAVLQFGFVHYWMDSYFGGALAATGGCLVLGAVARFRECPRVRYGVWFGMGLALLGNTRPYEGSAVGLVVLAAVAYRALASPAERKAWTLRFVLPAFLVAAPAAAVTLMQIRAVTGSVRMLPHELYRKRVAVWPTFIWDHPRPAPHYEREVQRKFFVDWEPDFQEARYWPAPAGILPAALSRVLSVSAGYGERYSCYFPHFAYLPLALMSLCGAGFRRIRLLGAAIGAVLAGNALVYWLLPHYLAPVMGAMLVVHLEFLRRLRTRRWFGRRAGRYAFGGVLCVLAVLYVYRFGLVFADRSGGWKHARARIARQLEGGQAKQLVLVRYGPAHDPHQEWVYNGPDLDKARLVWALSLSPGQDRELTEYFRGRQVWLLEPDSDPHRLIPLSRAGAESNKVASRF